MTTRTLHHSDILRLGDVFHLTRAVLPRSAPKGPHNHDYFEVFWIQNGRARHRINGEKHELSEGQIVFIRPDDTHSLQGLEDETRLVNLILSPDLVVGLIIRFPELANRFFWQDGALPARHHRDMRQLASLSHDALLLERGPRSRLRAEAFVLSLCTAIIGDAPRLPDGLPTWLRDACLAAQSPEVFSDGAAGLVRVAGRAHAHVSRMVQKYMHTTPTDYINTVRMDHAARRLTGTGDPLPEIAADIGIPNMSHFHRLFRDAHGMTPKQFRTKYQRDVISPL